MNQNDSSDASIGSPPPAVEVGGQIVNSVTNEITKALALTYGVDPMTASMLGGTAGGTLSGLAQQMYARRRNRSDRALQAARDVSGHDRQELFELALRDDRKLELLIHAIEAAMREADEQRVRFYGRIAATGILAEDDAHVDRASRIFSTIASLDTADVKVLLHVASPGTADGWRVDPWQQGTEEGPALSTDLPELVDVLDSIVARLETAGILTIRSEGGISFGTWYTVTNFARTCVAELLEG